MSNIDIKCYNEVLYQSHIVEDMFCEKRVSGHILIWVISGKEVIESPSGQYVFKKGDFGFLRRDCASTIKKGPDGDEPFSAIAFVLQRSFLKEYYAKNVEIHKMESDIKAIEEPAVHLPNTVELQSLFSSLKAYTDNQQELSASILNLKLSEAVVSILQIAPQFYPTLFDFTDAWKIDLLDFMERYYMFDMSMDDFAYYTGRSLATFKRDFAKVSQVTPQKWIMEHRLDLAYSLLKEKKLKVSDVLERTGFRNRSHFSSSFKSRFGVAPANINSRI